jgi:hypothetical protein
MRGTSTMIRQVKQLRAQARMDNLPVEKWTADDWLAVLKAFEAGADQVTHNGFTITQDVWQRVLELRQARAAERNATVCDWAAVQAEARGFTSLAAECREQASNWRAKKTALEAPPAVG